MAELLNCTTFNGVKMIGVPFAGSGSYLLGLGTNILQNSCVDNVCGTFIGANVGYGICCNTLRTVAIGYSIFSRKVLNKVNLCDLVLIGSCAAQQFCNNSSITRSVGIGSNSFCCVVDSPSQNVSIGHNSMRCISQALKNVVVGNDSALCLTSVRNVVVGHRAGYCLGPSSENVLIGYKAGYQLGNYANNNIMIGYNAGSNLLGACCGIIAIGHSAETGFYNDYHTVWGNSDNTCNFAPRKWDVLSDKYDKANIEEIPDELGLNFIRKLKPVKFKYDMRDRYVRKCGFEWGQKDNTLSDQFDSYGFLAQDVKTTLLELNVRFDGLTHNDISDTHRLNYTELISPIIKSLKQTIERLDDLEKKLSVS